jgi:hypothetical membrane protein
MRLGAGPVWKPLMWAGVIGPAVFVADWATLSALRAGYSPVEDAISRLAELGTSTRPAMTAGFVVYGAGLIGYGLGLRCRLPGPAWALATATGLATFGVATFPLGTPTSGTIHAGFAVLGYATLAALPLVASRELSAAGRPALGRLSVLAGSATAAFLLASAVGAPAHGLTQRIGLTLGDAWVAVSALAWLRGRSPGQRRPSRV